MVDKQVATPTHRIYSITRRAGRDEDWLSIGLVFSHPDLHGLMSSFTRFRSAKKSSAGVFRRITSVSGHIVTPPPKKGSLSRSLLRNPSNATLFPRRLRRG